jgi:hypothetical protein
LRFAAHFPGVTCALNGLTYADQVVEGVRAVEKGAISEDKQAALLTNLRELYENVRHFCTACGYCRECPVGIQIPKVLESYANLLLPSMFEAEIKRLAEQMTLDPDSYDPSLCTACRQCEEKCPNKLPIAKLMEETAARWPKRS